MLKKIAVIGGIVAVAGLGVGGAAWAGSNAPTPQATVASSANGVTAPAVANLTTTAAPSTAPSTDKSTGKAAKAKGARAKHPALARRLEKVSHAQWVSKDGKTGTFVTHDAARGTVSAVGAGSITIGATDGTAETFVVDSVTKVHVKGGAKGTTGTISQVKVGDAAGVLGTGAGTMTATHITDRGVPKAPKTATPKVPTTAAPTTS